MQIQLPTNASRHLILIARFALTEAQVVRRTSYRGQKDIHPPPRSLFQALLSSISAMVEGGGHPGRSASMKGKGVTSNDCQHIWCSEHSSRIVSTVPPVCSLWASGLTQESSMARGSPCGGPGRARSVRGARPLSVDPHMDVASSRANPTTICGHTHPPRVVRSIGWTETKKRGGCEGEVARVGLRRGIAASSMHPPAALRAWFAVTRRRDRRLCVGEPAGVTAGRVALPSFMPPATTTCGRAQTIDPVGGKPERNE